MFGRKKRESPSPPPLSLTQKRSNRKEEEEGGEVNEGKVWRRGRAIVGPQLCYHESSNSSDTTIVHLRALIHTNTHILNHRTITDTNTYVAIFYLGF